VVVVVCSGVPASAVVKVEVLRQYQVAVCQRQTGCSMLARQCHAPRYLLSLA